MRLQTLLSIFSLLVILPSASADTLHLRDGGSIVGTAIARQAGTVVMLEHSGQKLVVDASRIKTLVFDDAAKTECTRRRKGLAFIDADGHLELARWADARGLGLEARAVVDHVLEIDPDHPVARAMLGQRKEAGKWVSAPKPAPGKRRSTDAKTDPNKVGAKAEPPKAEPPVGGSKAEVLAHQVDGLKKLIADKKQRRKVARLVRQLADPSAKRRVQARDDLLLFARGARRADLAQVAGKIYRHWSDHYTRPSGPGATVTTDFRVRQTSLVRPIPQRNISLGGSTSSQVRIQTPTVNSIGVNTTAILPANRPRR